LEHLKEEREKEIGVGEKAAEEDDDGPGDVGARCGEVNLGPGQG
jgi:hypothetical protein